jgi:hypothetical protein
MHECENDLLTKSKIPAKRVSKGICFGDVCDVALGVEHLDMHDLGVVSQKSARMLRLPPPIPIRNRCEDPRARRKSTCPSIPGAAWFKWQSQQ